MDNALNIRNWDRRPKSREEARDEAHARLVYFMDIATELEALGGRLGLLSERAVAGLQVAKRRAEKRVERLEDRL